MPSAMTIGGPIPTSSAGGGNYGNWISDGFGLPAYVLKNDNSSLSQIPLQVGGASEFEHQIGNDHIVADASPQGYVSLWSQDRLYEWVNHYDSGNKHYSGGFGYLNVNGKVFSDLSSGKSGQPAVSSTFGVGYSKKVMTASNVHVSDIVFAPFGNDPVLLDDVTLENKTTSKLNATWYEYFDVNPYFVTSSTNRGFSSPSYDPSTKTLSVTQDSMAGDFQPMSIYAASLGGPLSGFETSLTNFFGNGSETTPEETATNSVTDSLAPPVANGEVGDTVFVFKSEVTLLPNSATTLRYAYGSADASEVSGIVRKYSSLTNSFASSEKEWNAYLPRVTIGTTQPWLGRELAWDAYMLRSGATYEECAGEHVISQGGYYQYGSGGMQIAYRDPLQFALPLIYSDPELAGEIILYSAKEQSQSGSTPYGMKSLCQQESVGVSDDDDVWLLLAAAEYGLATKDFAFFNQEVPYYGGGSGTLLDHLITAYKHQESLIGPHGDYLAGSSGDWSDFSTYFLHMTESSLVTAQVAAIYPLMAELASALGDTTFESQLNASALRAKNVLASEWTPKGWQIRGWDNNKAIGTGVIFEEPQPWAMLAGIYDADKSSELISNIRRYLTGIGAPSYLNGPSKIGSSQSPARNDPGVSEWSGSSGGVGTNNAVFVGGTWYSLNGVLVWGMANLDPGTPNAAKDAFDEYLRNTLYAHATAFPSSWDGILSVDDACNSFYSTNPSECGISLESGYRGQIMHQPAWSLFDTFALSGIAPTANGFDITPHWPDSDFSVQFPDIGLSRNSNWIKGYFVTRGRQASVAGTQNAMNSKSSNNGSKLEIRVSLPKGTSITQVRVFDGSISIPFSSKGESVTFDLPAENQGRTNFEIQLKS